jgi:RNA polymerase sigma-70 factor (sigma-E family)
MAMDLNDPEFERFFNTEYPHVLRSVFLMCHDRHRAQDLTQDAFVEAVRRWERVRELDRPGAWVRRVAIRLTVRAVHRERVRPGLEAASGWPEKLSGHNIDVLHAVRRLPARQRAAVVLFYFDDAPVTEIAQTLGCSEATVRVHLHRARTALARALGSERTPRRAT